MKFNFPAFGTKKNNMTQGKEDRKQDASMNQKDWLIMIALFAMIIPAMFYFAENNEKKLFDVTIQNGKYNLYGKSGECMKGLSKDSLDKVLMYEYQIDVK